MALHRYLRVRILNIQRSSRCWSGNGLTARDEFIKEEKGMRVEIEKVILKNTEISQTHLTPELKLHLLTPNCPLYHASAETIQSTNANGAVEKTFFQDPFWSIYWPGGQVLTRFILDMGIKLLSNKFNKNSRVLDLGSGCGASAIAAKLVGARQVLANDIDPVACVAILMNAKLNNVDLRVSKENLIEGKLNELFNVILIGDLLYDEKIAEKLIPWLERSLRAGSQIYIGDPGRHALNQDLKKRMSPIF
ncbi:electron transfer flavoprotein beta subunit lysine methyltransferase-like isoform X2 [Leptopilina heterotoma]|uniref:electron transfer flavoprotein beta subunit lysine methyltransferase-like isoform X2 n=1 Tax=Leptopilina heterotoma TaxID=63436 RepID=UPI001CA8E1FF|nr:electron transfer flavoprotein beta subunit lysine methyltransferase-like isoform X2 [Leptopilina heterotoma]